MYQDIYSVLFSALRFYYPWYTTLSMDTYIIIIFISFMIFHDSIVKSNYDHRFDTYIVIIHDSIVKSML